MYNEVFTVAWFNAKKELDQIMPSFSALPSPKRLDPFPIFNCCSVSGSSTIPSQTYLSIHIKTQLIKSIWQEVRGNSGKDCRLCSRTELGLEAAAVVVSDSEVVVRLLEVQLLRLLSWSLEDMRFRLLCLTVGTRAEIHALI